MTFSIKYLIKSILTLFVTMGLLGTTLSAKEPTQAERNAMAAKLIPIITMLLMDGDSTPPAKPSISTVLPTETTEGVLAVEVHGEAGAGVYANGVKLGTIAANGTAQVKLTFANGVNAIAVTLRDAAGNESEALTFSVTYDAPPVITIIGDVEPYIAKGETYADLGATAIDVNDGSVAVETNGTVDTSVIGEHNITYTARDSRGTVASKIRMVHVIQAGVTVEVLPMDITKVEGFNGATEPAKLSGIIKNQYWIQDFGTLSEAELRTIVSSYPILTVIGYSDVYGLLVEIPENSAEANSAIKSIELTEKIQNVRNRVYIGADTVGINSITIPNDNVSGYYDDGDNWHLEYINILDAWEITTGSGEVAIGVVDGGFYTNHEDITIKDGNLVAPIKKHSHGTAVVSIIAADTNNTKGITGINWKSAVVGSLFKDLEDNISYEPAQYFANIFEESQDKDKVKLVNCSFGPKTLYKTVEGAIEASIKQHDNTRKYKYKNKLFIFSAGNEYGDAKFGNGSLHDDGFGTYESINDNILIVAAVLKDGTLPCYSNYGETVDIAAPTAMKTAKSVFDNKSTYHIIENPQYYGTDNTKSRTSLTGVFNGTSAAAPVVTGVASLIYSLNPDFTPQEVKKILLDSTGGRKACLRHKLEKYTDETKNQIEGIPGGHCIPILNAGNALALAKKIVEAKEAHLLHYYPSVFSNLCNVYIKPPTSALHIESLDLSVQGKKRSDGIWENIAVAPSNAALTELADNSHELAFPTDGKYVEYNVTGTLTYQGYSSIYIELIVPHTTVETYVEVKDKLSQVGLDNVVMNIDYLNIDFQSKYVTKINNNVDNNITLYLERGIEYKIIAKKDTYKDYAESYAFGSSVDLFKSRSIEMLSSTSDTIGNIAGRVLSEDGTRITNASVSLVSSAGTVKTSMTQKNGIYRLLDIPILDNNDAFITYNLEVTRAGYLSETVEAIGLSDGQTVSKSITLKKDPNYTNFPPVANAGDDQSITLGQSVTLSASASSDVETANAYLSYKWSGADIDTSHDENITLTNLTLGVHHIVLQVTDEEGAVSTDTVDVTVSEAGTITHNGTTYGTVTSPYTGKVWLDRNLGASRVCTAFNDTACYGDYYQWGRNYDGHQSSTSSTTSTQATDVNNAGSSFITSSSTYNYDWAKNADSDGSLRSANWAKIDGTSVCPVGFRVPTITELKAELLDANSAQIQNREDAFNSFLKLPSAGYRYGGSGALSYQGSWGYVWSSSVNGSFSHCVYFYSGIAYTNGSNRAYGFTVRCLRD